MKDEKQESWKAKLVVKMRQTYRWGEQNIPPGLRSIAGLLLIVGGIFGFLPVLGFWMIPLGAVLLALDIPPLRRRLRKRLDRMARPEV